MPIKLEKKLIEQGKKKGLKDDKLNAYVYGTLRNTGWKPEREKTAGVGEIAGKIGKFLAKGINTPPPPPMPRQLAAPLAATVAVGGPLAYLTHKAQNEVETLKRPPITVDNRDPLLRAQHALNGERQREVMNRVDPMIEAWVRRLLRPVAPPLKSYIR